MATHDCPGGCGRQAPYHHYACRGCWYRLPKTYRDDIWRYYQADAARHAAAMTAAFTWYLEHP